MYINVSLDKRYGWLVVRGMNELRVFIVNNLVLKYWMNILKNLV